MTIEDLLRHTTGLASSPTGPQEFVDLYRAAKLGDRSGTLQDLIARLGNLPLAASPGEQWVYSRSTDVLGRLIEVISGKSLDIALRELVFEPLAMADTGFYVRAENQLRFSSNHKITEPGALVVAGKPGKDPYSERPTMFWASGGLVSTATDYFRFAQMLLNKGELDGRRLLSPKTVELMTTNRVPPQAMPLSMHDPAFDWMVKGCGFGLGFRVIVDPTAAEPTASLGSYGWFGANDTYFLVDPKEQLIGIFLAQVSLSSRTPYPGVREFQSLMYQSIVR
jgi:CubicO group peptidase (beta-lactamase class C family)